MAKVTFHCDGCGKQEDGYFVDGQAKKPRVWYKRSDEDGTQIACSDACIKKVAAASGKTDSVIPSFIGY